MQKFMKEYGIKDITSSPRYPLGKTDIADTLEETFCHNSSPFISAESFQNI